MTRTRCPLAIVLARPIAGGALAPAASAQIFDDTSQSTNGQSSTISTQQRQTRGTTSGGEEGELQGKEVEYATMQRFRGPENVDLAGLRSDIAGLRAQIARTTPPSTGATGPNVAGLTAIQLRYLTLYRGLQFQLQIYNVYQRSQEHVAVEELAAESASYIQVIDAAGVAPERQYNIWAIAAFAEILLLALFTEWYAPVTGLFDGAAGRARRSAEEFA